MTIIVVLGRYREYSFGMEPSPALPDRVRRELMSLIDSGSQITAERHERIAAWARSMADNTLRAAASDLRIVTEFQRRDGRPSLPIAPRDLYLLLEERAQKGTAKASLDRLVAMMVRLHAVADLPTPIDEMVRWKQKEIRRTDGRASGQARGLRLKGDVSDFASDPPKLVSLAALVASIPDDPRGLRDRALLLVGYDAGLRRSELVRIKYQHIEPSIGGEGALLIPRSKTDQDGFGARAWISRQTMAALETWLAVSKIDNGYVFRSLSYRTSQAGHLAEGSVNQILKGRLATFLESLVNIGKLDRATARQIVCETSGHSLRVGCDQDLFAAGVDIGAIMQGLRWSSPKQPLAYARHLAPATSKLASVMRKVVRPT